MVPRFRISGSSRLITILLILFHSLSSKASPDSLSTASDTFKVALLLPLYAAQLEQLDTVPDQSAQLISSSIPALHFYEAARMFRDSLAANGRTVEFRVLDTGQDTSSVMKQLNVFRGGQYDAVISMLPMSFQPYLTSASNRWKKPVYVFQSSNAGPLQKSQWLRLVLPSNNTQIRMTAMRLIESYPNAEIHTVYRDQRNEREVARLFKSVIDSMSNDTMRCRPFQYKGQGWTGFAGRLSREKKNLVIVPTIDESFLSSCLNALEPVRKEHDIVLCGMPSWEGFESIDPVLLQEMNTILFNGYHIDGSSPDVMEFRRAFVNEFHADPLAQAYMAWDALALAYNEWLGEELQDARLIRCLNIRSDLVPVCEGCGKENRLVPILKYHDFTLIPIGTD
jgi:hypothetical protein